MSEISQFFLTRPTDRQLADFLASRRQDGRHSYAQLEMTRGRACAGFVTDQYSHRLGTGEQDFETACRALRSWRMFDLGWVRLEPADTPFEVGQTVAIMVNHFGFWSLNACRIVYLIERSEGSDESMEYGFAYGTLNEHIEIGEERFSIKMNPDGSVWYQVTAMSTPNHILAKVGYPFGRMLQKRFARDSGAAMLAAMTP